MTSPLRRSGLRRAAVVALAAVAAVVGVPPAGAQEPDRGLFGIAPSKVLLRTEPPRDVRPLQLTNTTRLTYDVRIFAAPLRQADDGGLAFDGSAGGRRLGRRTLRLGATKYVMEPNSRRDLDVRWLRTFPGLRVAPMGIVVEGVPRRKAQSGNVGQDYQLVATYLLRLPTGSRDGQFERLTAEQGPERSLLFTAVVRNTGEVYDEPVDGRVVVTDESGRTVARGRFAGELILPGGSRAFTVTTRERLTAGEYTARASMLFGGGKRRISQRFRLVGPNELPTTKLEIADLQGVGYVGEAARATVRVRNTGSVETTATVRTRLFEAPGGQRAATAAGEARAERRLAPGEQATVEVSLGKELRDRDHVIEAAVSAGKVAFDTDTITISPRAERSAWSRFERWVSGNAVLLVVLLALLAVAAIAESTRRYRRRLRAAAAGPAVPVAPPAASPIAPASASVDLNTATAEQLCELPGIGPRAARRIVDWREEYGRFESVDGLQAVEGFDAERIAMIAALLRADG